MYMDSDTEIHSFNEMELEHELEKLDVSVQHVVSNKDESNQTFDMASVEVQTENPVTTFPNVKVDETLLLNFVRRVAPMVDNELGKHTTKLTISDVSSDSEQEDESSETFVKITTLPKYSYDQAKQVKHITQNCNKTRIAISVVYKTCGRYTCGDTSSVIIYKKNRKGKYYISNEPITVEGCITSMAYHPSSEFILAVSTIGGKLLLMNTEDSSQTLSVKKKCVIQVSWVSPKNLLTSPENSQLLAVACWKGTLSLWSVSPNFVTEPKEVGRLNIMNRVTDASSEIRCFSFSTVEPFVVIGTSHGDLLCFSTLSPRYEKGKLVRKYWKCSSAILSVEFNPCDVVMLAALYDDGVIRIFDFNQFRPVHFIHPPIPVLGMQWNFDQFGVVKTWGIIGYICFFNQKLGSGVKGFRVSEDIASVIKVLSSVSKKKSNHQELTVLNSYGEVSIWQGPLHI